MDEHPHRTHRSRSAATVVRVVIALVALAVGAFAWWYFAQMDRGSTAASAAAAPPMPPPVTVSQPLVREIVEWDEYTGQFAAIENVEVRARVSGYLQSITFQEGQMVKAGDLLFVIDPRPFDIALASATARFSEAQARLELANRQLARAGTLRERDFVAASVYDERTQEMRTAAAAVETARAAVHAAELDVEFTRVTAPISGRIGRREVSIGNLVSGGSGGETTLLTTIVSQDPIHFVFDMSEAEFLAYQRAVAEGKLQSTRDRVRVFAKLADERDWTLEGYLDFVDNQLDRGAGTIRARAVFPNPGRLVTPGQFGRLRMPGSEPYEAVLVPDSVIVTDQARKLVLTVAEDGTVVPKMIRPGPSYGNMRIVRNGLGREDRIIINGLMRARPGGKVTPQPGEIEALTGAPQG